MAGIQVLDQHTIDQIAAGEVVENPKSVVKELVENAIDAGAKAVSVEILDGGTSFIRVTDNGAGIAAREIRTAFYRHATSKITGIEDLETVMTLGFRGEALSSIAAVSETEVVTKTPDALTGIRYCINGGAEASVEEVGAPNGTTIIVRNLFYNVPARKKFLKHPKTEGAYVAELMELLALSHPDVSFHFVQNRQEKFHTSGNGDLKELIHRIYGRETAAALREISASTNDGLKLWGYLGEPTLNRSTRSFEIFFVNGRFIKNSVLQKALEEGYKEYLMQHKFPFAVLHLSVSPDTIDVNVHPAKLEIKFHDASQVYDFVSDAVFSALKQNEMIPDEHAADRLFPLHTDTVAGVLLQKRSVERAPQPFEENRAKVVQEIKAPPTAPEPVREKVLSNESRRHFRIIGQVFETYWLFEYKDNLYMIDQHAAHEKVNYERFLKRYRNREMMTQSINPPLIAQLTSSEAELFRLYAPFFKDLGFVIEPFGGSDYAIREIPLDLYGSTNARELFLAVLDELSEESGMTDPKVITDKIASMACKASVKGSTLMHEEEIEALLDELLTLENPYNCPHGRPTIITMSKYELDKRFQRVVN